MAANGGDGYTALSTGIQIYPNGDPLDTVWPTPLSPICTPACQFATMCSSCLVQPMYALWLAARAHHHQQTAVCGVHACVSLSE